LKAERIPIAERIGINELQLAIEIDGDSHQFKDKYDEKRQKDLEAYGIIFLRFEDGAIKQQMFSVLFVRL
jgi:very-short-patch-repair endonuclease